VAKDPRAKEPEGSTLDIVYRPVWEVERPSVDLFYAKPILRLANGDEVQGVLRQLREKSVSLDSDLGPLTVELLCPEPAPSAPITALLGETERAASGQKRAPKEATVWARLLLGLYDDLGAVRCVFARGLRDLDLGARERA